MSKKIAVLLSGCGVYDGAEIHESVITLLRLDQRGAQVQCFAPDIPQMHVINHLTGEEMPESRNVLVESARIARGNIKGYPRSGRRRLRCADRSGRFRGGQKPLQLRHRRCRLHRAAGSAGPG